MITVILIAIIAFLLVLGCGVAIWFVLRKKQALKSQEPVVETIAEVSLSFHWSYIILPVAIFLLSIILVACFYHRLPVDLAYHFQSDGSPDKWVGRGALILWMLTPQLIFTLLAGVLIWGVTRLSALFQQPDNTWVQPRILLVMGNMIALPQIILFFAMLDIFSYNSYQIHILPLWVFALIITGLGGIVLGVFFIQAMRQAWRAN